MWGSLLCSPYWGPGLQPRHVPWLGIEPATLWFAACTQSIELHQLGIFSFKIFVLLFKKIYLLIMLLQLSISPLFTPLHPTHILPPTFPPYSSCPWVMHISSLAATFPILFLPSPCLFSTYHLCYLFSAPFPLSSPPTPLLICLLYTSDAADDWLVV